MASGRTFLELVTFFRVTQATLGHVIVVTADVYELQSGVPRRLEKLGVTVVRRRLPIGDYIVGQGAIVERKTVRGLHRSLVEGRLWTQLASVRRSATWPYLLIEGFDLTGGPLSYESVRGLWLTVAELGIDVLRSNDAEDTAAWLLRLASRRQEPSSRDRPAYAQRFPRARPHPAEAALAAAPGVSVKTARRLLKRFGSLGEVVAAERDEWQSIPGVGPRRAASLASMVHDRWVPDRITSHSDVNRNGKGPST
jgi:DNA excision repair protein ERCC-4